MAFNILTKFCWSYHSNVWYRLNLKHCGFSSLWNNNVLHWFFKHSWEAMKSLVYATWSELCELLWVSSEIPFSENFLFFLCLFRYYTVIYIASHVHCNCPYIVIIITKKGKSELSARFNLGWQLIADRNEWPSAKPYKIIRRFLFEPVCMTSLDRNYWEVINLLFVLPGLYLNILDNQGLKHRIFIRDIKLLFAYLIKNHLNL